jgi:hypothetical protein
MTTGGRNQGTSENITDNKTWMVIEGRNQETSENIADSKT